MADSERVISLVRTIAADSSLRDRLSAAPESDRGAILAELGYQDVTPADVASNAHLFVPQAVEEIDDEQLASVAGGGGDTVTTATTTTTVTAAASAAVAT
jgi:anthranilate phosphoribosyltransferase